jgi:hypothetical protein
MAFAEVLRVERVQKSTGQTRMMTQEEQQGSKRLKEDQGSEEGLKSDEEGPRFQDTERDIGPPCISA